MKKYLQYIKEELSYKEIDIYDKSIQLLKDDYNNFKIKFKVDNYSFDSNFIFYENDNIVIGLYLMPGSIEIVNRVYHIAGDASFTHVQIRDKYRLKEIIDIIVKYFIKEVPFEMPNLFFGSENDFVINIKKDIYRGIYNTYEGQKYLIEKGEISTLKDVEINDRILQEYPEMKDIKKQTDWN